MTRVIARCLDLALAQGFGSWSRFVQHGRGVEKFLLRADGIMVSTLRKLTGAKLISAWNSDFDPQGFLLGQWKCGYGKTIGEVLLDPKDEARCRLDKPFTSKAHNLAQKHREVQSNWPSKNHLTWFCMGKSFPPPPFPLPVPTPKQFEGGGIIFENVFLHSEWAHLLICGLANRPPLCVKCKPLLSS
jgi:hypothetical protein